MPTLQPYSWVAQLWCGEDRGWRSIGPSGGERYLYRTRDCAAHCHLYGEAALDQGRRRIIRAYEPPNMPLMCPRQKALAADQDVRCDCEPGALAHYSDCPTGYGGLPR